MCDLFVTIVDPSSAQALAEGRPLEHQASVLYQGRGPVAGARVENIRFVTGRTAAMFKSNADGLDEHGFAVNSGPRYSGWANDQHARGSLQNLHHITTHRCEIESAGAHAESYVIGLFLNPDRTTSWILTGRYIDRLERCDGKQVRACVNSTAKRLSVSVLE